MLFSSPFNIINDTETLNQIMGCYDYGVARINLDATPGLPCIHMYLSSVELFVPVQSGLLIDGALK